MHTRDPRDGRPSQAPEHFVPILETLKHNTNAVISLTNGGSPHMTVAERMRSAKDFKPEPASLNMGSMNFGLYRMLSRFKEFEHDWEREGLGESRDMVFKNTFADIQATLEMGREDGTRFEFECYDISHLNLELATPDEADAAAQGLRRRRFLMRCTSHNTGDLDVQQ